MITISLCMIVKNEEDVLARCLSSVEELVDEMIVVDTGSTDRTKEIAAQYTKNIYDYKWTDNFAAARNFAFSKAAMDFCMWLDADDMILPADQAAFLALKKTLADTVDVVMMKYNTGFDEQGNVTFSYYRERLIKNHSGLLWQGAVHEAIQPAGEIVYSEAAITHHKLHPSDPDRNLKIYEKQLKAGEILEPRQQFYFGRELYYHQRYEEAIGIFKKFLAEGGGWVENNIEACRHSAYCHYKLERPEEALKALLQSFAFDRPRAEVCCDIGRHFFDRGKDSLAAYWYEQALACQRDDNRGGFTCPDCYGYIPCIQLCVCYSRMGEITRAIAMNEKAGVFKPDSPAVAYNRHYFADSLQGQEKQLA